MRRVILESPFRTNERTTEDEHRAYARRCLLDAARRGEAPLASHLLYTQILDDSVLEDRALGIRMGLAWYAQADALVVYTDYGISEGMKQGIAHAASLNITIEYRQIGRNNGN